MTAPAGISKSGLTVILISATFTVMAGAVIAPVINLIRSAFEVSSTLSGILVTVHAFSIAIFSPIGGWLIDRLGTKKPYIIGLFLYGVSGGLGFFVSSFPALLICRVMQGIGVAFFFNAITVMILNLYKGEDRNRVMGYRASANHIGGILWPIIGGALGSITWHHPFLIYTLGIVLAAIAIFTLPETRAESVKDATTNQPVQPSVKLLFREKPLLLLIYASVFITYLLLYSVVVFLPLLLSSAEIMNPLIISIFLSSISVSGGGSALLYGKIKKSLSQKRVADIALTCILSGFLFLAVFSSPAVWIAGLVVFGAGLGLIVPCLMVWTGELVPGSLRGRMTSYLGLAGFLGQFTAPLIFGPFTTVLGKQNIYFISSSLALLLIIFYRFVRQGESRSC